MYLENNFKMVDDKLSYRKLFDEKMNNKMG